MEETHRARHGERGWRLPAPALASRAGAQCLLHAPALPSQGSSPPWRSQMPTSPGCQGCPAHRAGGPTRRPRTPYLGATPAPPALAWLFLRVNFLW